MKINASEIRVGMLLEYKNDLWQVLKTQHVKPGKGGAFAQVEMKSVGKNTKLNERFRSSETVEKASLDENKYNYLYEDDTNYFFMEPKTFEQIEIKKEIIGEQGKLLTENLEVSVSFYNENPDSAIFPSPIIGMLGLIEDVENHTTTPGLKSEGDVLIYIGADRKGLGATEYLKVIHGLTTGDSPELDIDFEVKLQNALLEAIQSGLITAAHDISDGGLSIALAEMCIFGKMGATVDLSVVGGNTHEVLFSEAQSGIVISVDAANFDQVMTHFEDADIPAYKLGEAGGYDLLISGLDALEVAEMASIHDSVIPNAMDV